MELNLTEHQEELFNKYFDFMESLPESKFDIRKIVTEFDEKNNCGSICCGIGWLAEIFPESCELYEYKKNYLVVTHDGSNQLDILLMTVFELNMDQVNLIEDEASVVFSFIPFDIYNKAIIRYYGKPLNKITPKDLCQKLRTLVGMGKVNAE